MNRFGQGVAAALVAGTAFLSIATAASSAERVYLTGPLDKNEMVSELYEPKKVTFGDDSELRVSKIRWSKWSTGEAKGVGTAVVGKSRYRARILLNYPRSGDCDHPVWTRAAVTAVSGKRKTRHYSEGGECFSDGEEG